MALCENVITKSSWFVYLINTLDGQFTSLKANQLRVALHAFPLLIEITLFGTGSSY
jgi:hypothetical protein